MNILAPMNEHLFPVVIVLISEFKFGNMEQQLGEMLVCWLCSIMDEPHEMFSNVQLLVFPQLLIELHSCLI
jgi:hypothetical protein